MEKYELNGVDPSSDVEQVKAKKTLQVFYLHSLNNKDILETNDINRCV